MAVNKRIRKTKVVWEVDWRDATHKRRYEYFDTKREADSYFATKTNDKGGNPHVRFEDVASRWLELAGDRVRVQTLDAYRRHLRVHVLPAFGTARVAKIAPWDVEAFLTAKLRSGLKPKTVSCILTTLSGVFNRAVKDGELRMNPAFGIGAEIGLRRRARRRDVVKAFTMPELDRLLETTKDLYPHLFPAFFTMARTGIRIGEAIGLKWSDVDLGGRLLAGKRVYQITVQRNMLHNGRTGATKSDRVRGVDMNTRVRDVLKHHRSAHLEERLRLGRELEDWVFQRPRPFLGEGSYLRRHSIDSQFKRILRRAELDDSFHPHCLRHTFAAVHIARGTNHAYIKEQLGHSGMSVFYEVYWHCLSKTDMVAAESFEYSELEREAVSELDE